MPEPRPDTAALVETVQEGVNVWVRDVETRNALHDAIDALAERIAELERERDILFKGEWAALNLRAQVAEDKLAEAEAALERIAGAPSRTDNEDEKLIAARALRSLRGETTDA